MRTADVAYIAGQVIGFKEAWIRQENSSALYWSQHAPLI